MAVPEGAPHVIWNEYQNGAGIEPYKDQITRTDFIGFAQPVYKVDQGVKSRGGQGDAGLLWPARHSLFWWLFGHPTHSSGGDIGRRVAPRQSNRDTTGGPK